MLLACLIAWLLLVRPAAAEGPGAPTLPSGWTLYDGGALLEPSQFQGATSMPVELAIDYFSTGLPPVRWDTSTSPTVAFCTRQANRPSWVTAAQFRDAVEHGVRVWAEAEARVGFAYTGDCSGGGSWARDNGINEIGWDDHRDEVRSPAAAITWGTWPRFGPRFFTETDIIFDQLLNVPEACLRSTMAHELGHALGLGHSTTFGDLMWPSFNSLDVSTCPQGPSAAERAMVQGMYGVNRAPVFPQQAQQTVAAGQRVTLEVAATDPEGDPLTYSWTQTGGPPLAFTSSGPAVSFTTPATEGRTVTFRVEASDPYGHRASTMVSVLVQRVSNAPAVPSLASILPGAGQRMTLTWDSPAAATAYEFCSTPTGTGQTSCARQPSPAVQVTWDTVLTEPAGVQERRVFTSGTRETSMRACNARGCSAVGVGPHAGGLRWAAHQVDYDYFAMAFDVPGTGLRFTILGVVNVEGPARRFSLHTGPPSDPTARRIMNCGNLAAGGTCIGLIGPSDRGHGPVATVVSERAGTPVLEHHVRIR